MIGQGCDQNGEGRDGCGRSWCRKCYPQKRLSMNAGDAIDTDIHEPCRKALLAAQQEAGMYKIKYEQLQIIYNKLADQWNVFQATSRPDNRNIQRAEGAGEMARKLAEVLLGVAYSKDVRDLLEKILENMGDAGGQEIEISGALVKR